MEDRVQVLVNSFDASELSKVAAAWEIAEAIDGNLPSLLVEAFPKIRKWQGRASILRYIGKFSRESGPVFNLGLTAIQDKAYDVRHYACALLAFSLRPEALTALKALLQHPDGRTVQDARAAMDAIQNKNHHFFKDRDHSGRIKWEYGSV
jgi:hypothetical protein